MDERESGGRRSRTAQHRRMEIIEAVLASERVRTRDLAEIFGIGQNLLANDLNYLEALGLVERGHGWIRRRASDVSDFFSRTEFGSRQGHALHAKQGIARYIAAQLREGSQVLFDSGSTALEIGMQLASTEKNLRVVTNNQPLAMYVAKHSTLSCDIVGGSYDRDNAATTGVEAAHAIESRKFDAAILAPRALLLADGHSAASPDRPTGRATERALRGLAEGRPEILEGMAEQVLCLAMYSLDPAQFPYKSTLIKNASKLYIALDPSKFAASGQCFFTIILHAMASPSRALSATTSLGSSVDSARGAFLPVRTRGPVIARRAEESPSSRGGAGSPSEDPVDVREPESVEVVTYSEDGSTPPVELVQLLQMFRGHPEIGALAEIVQRVFVVVGSDGIPLAADWCKSLLS